MANIPSRDLGPKVHLLAAVGAAKLPPKAQAAALARGADPQRGTGRSATLADQLSLLVDCTGHRSMLQASGGGNGRPAGEPAGVGDAGRRLPFATASLDHAAPGNAASGEMLEGQRALVTLNGAKDRSPARPVG